MGFHLKFGGFHVKSKDHLQGIVTLCFLFVELFLKRSTAQFPPGLQTIKLEN